MINTLTYTPMIFCTLICTCLLLLIFVVSLIVLAVTNNLSWHSVGVIAVSVVALIIIARAGVVSYFNWSLVHVRGSAQ
jgi:hypothetical protein